MSIFCSWSGGKDSTLALWHGLKMFGKVDYLFTMFSEDGIHSRAHGLTKELLQRQSSSIGIPLITKSSSWEQYENKFLEFLKESVNGGTGIFGDIDLEGHKEWVENICRAQNVTAVEPLWGRKREEVIKEFLDLGFKAKIISIKKELNIEKYLGIDLNYNLIEEFKNLGIDISGENGEYHTFVYAGPLFKGEVRFEVGEIIEREGVYALSLR
ncbi:MAG TPA: diphthine--ammonia ligase [bacterium]|nr:diphthine--ammonia ligase [bacterium]HOP55146.1 diphthine--ammonia ligase [bacterium]